MCVCARSTCILYIYIYNMQVYVNVPIHMRLRLPTAISALWPPAFADCALQRPETAFAIQWLFHHTKKAVEGRLTSQQIKDKITPNKTPWCSVIGIEPFAAGVKSIHYFKILYKRSIKGDGTHDPALCCRFCRTSCTLICFQLAIWIYLAEPQAKRTTARSAVFSGLRPNSTARLWM